MLETNYYDCCQCNKGDGSNNSIKSPIDSLKVKKTTHHSS
jgi:hypothetical protein